MTRGSALLESSKKVDTMHDWAELYQNRRQQTIAGAFILENGSILWYDQEPAPRSFFTIPGTVGVMGDLREL